MKHYTGYLFKSLQVFILCFTLGTLVDTQFRNYQNSIKNITNYQKIFLAFSQLITIITITFFLNTIKFFNQFFEEYTPNVLFSTFLLSLQSNMISNFKYLVDMYLHVS